MKKKKKLQKKELALRIGKLVEQFSDLNNRLNRVSHDRLNQGIQLNQLSEDSGGLQRRFEELRARLEEVVSQEEELRLLMQSLQLQEAEADTGSESSEAERQTQQQLSHLGQQLVLLQEQQQGLERVFESGGRAVDHIDNKADDLRRDLADMLNHIRRLEESGSELLVSDSRHESQIRSLQKDIADLSRRMEAEADTGDQEMPRQEVSQLLQESAKPLHQQIEHLGQQLSEKSGQQKELERRLVELSKRIGETGARLEHQQQDKTRFNEVLELRLSKLENLAKDLIPVSDADESQLAGLEQKLGRVEEELGSLQAKKGSAAEDYLLLDEKSRELATRLDALDGVLSEQAAKNSDLDDLVSHLKGELDNQSRSLDERLKAADLKLTHYLDEQAQRPDPMASISMLLEEQKDNFENTIELLKQEIRGLDSKLDSLDMDEHEASERLDSLATDLDHQAGSREEMQQALSSTRDELSHKVDELYSRLSATEALLKSQGDAAKDQLRQLASLTEGMAEQGKYGVDLKLTTATLREETDGLKARSDEFGSRIEKLQQSLQQGEERETRFSQQLSALEQEQTEIREQSELGIDSLLERVKSTQAMLSEQSGLNEGLSQRLDDLESSLQEQFRNIDTQQRKLIESESDNRERLTHQIQSTHSLSEAIAEVKTEHHALLEQTAEQKTFLEAMTSEYGKRQQESEEMGRHFAVLNGQVDSVRSTANYHTIAIGAVVLLLLFSALLGYNHLTNRIGDVERDISLELMRISENFVSRDEYVRQTDGSAYDTLALEELIKNQQRVEQQLVELEEQLAASINTTTSLDPGQDPEPTGKPTTILPSSGDEGVTQRFKRMDMMLDTLRSEFDSRIAQLEERSATRLDSDDQIAEKINEMASTLQGLKDEYHQMEAPSQSMTSEPPLKSAEAWQAMRKRGGYTIQLIGVSKREAIDAFVERHGLAGELAYNQTERNGSDWYTLLYGTYMRQAEAVKALRQLPEALKSLQPWIKRVPKNGTISPL
ncbi:MAG: SPOR domain-containing protein [Candidatus Thiodiazotropha sp.]